jgi:hypothetical protein
MKHFRVILIVLHVFMLDHYGHAQDNNLLDNRFGKYFEPEKSKLPKDRQVFSWDWKFSLYTEFFGRRQRDYTMLLNSSMDTVVRNKAINTVSLMSVGFEPRWNLSQRGKNVLGIKLAAHFNFSFTNEHPFVEGIFHTSQAVFLFLGQGYSGPYNNISPHGFAVNAGFINVFSPLITLGKSKKEFYEFYTPLPGSESLTRTIFFLPAVQFDYYSNNPLRFRPVVMSITAGYLNGTYLLRCNFGLPF